MNMRTIGVPKTEAGITEYLTAYPLTEGVFLKISDADIRKFFTFEAEDETVVQRIFADAIVDVLSTFYKTRKVMNEIANLDIERMDVIAYLGTLSAFERAEERGKIILAIGSDKYVNLDGLCHFRLDKTVDSWIELGKLAEKLICECISAPEVQELTAFMLGMTNVQGSVRLTYLTVPKVEKNGKFFPIAALTGKEDADIIFSLLKEAPKSIVVLSPDKFSENVLNTIRALGDGELS